MSNETTHNADGPPQDDPRLLLPVAEVATLLGLSTMTVYRRIRAGAWPSGRSGRKHLIPRAFVEGLVAEICAGNQVNFETYVASTWATKTEESA